MNFQELLQRISQLDQPVNEEPNEGNAFSGALDAARDSGKDEFEVDGKTFKVKEDEVDECGMDMGPGNPMKQQDNVSMNVSMNGSGSGGIKDLLDILRNIENGSGSEGDLEKMIGVMSHPDNEPLIGDETTVDEFANSPADTGMADPVYAPADAATPSGDDLHRAHGAYPAAQRGDNPMAIRERLETLYQEIKAR